MVIGLFECKLLNHSHAVCVNINILGKPGLTFVLVFLLRVFFALFESTQQYWTKNNIK